MTREEQTQVLAKKFFPHCAEGPDPKTEWAYRLILAHDDAIRRECAERADACLDRQGFKQERYGLRGFVKVSILGSEPAREES